MSNTFGKIFNITTWGESHGTAVGVVIDGCPAGLALTEKDIQKELDRRRPGQSKITTARAEGDRAEILSGLFEGMGSGQAGGGGFDLSSIAGMFGGGGGAGGGSPIGNITTVTNQTSGFNPQDRAIFDNLASQSRSRL